MRMRGALPLLLLAAAPALAEGRSDPILGCEFPGFALVLSEDGDGFAWYDDNSGQAGPAQCAGLDAGAAVCLLETAAVPLILAVTTGAAGDAAPFGAARLITPRLPGGGALDLSPLDGRCEALTP